jgi:hypothetical protein
MAKFITLNEGGQAGGLRVNVDLLTIYRPRSMVGGTQLVVNGWSGTVHETVEQIDKMIEEVTHKKAKA